MPPQQTASIRSILWHEGLPLGCLVAILFVSLGDLKHDQRLSALNTPLIWTTIWFVACLLSLYFLVGIGPQIVAGHRICQNIIMLWNMHGSTREMAAGAPSREDIMSAGMVTTVAAVASIYLTTRLFRPSARMMAAQGKSKSVDEEP